MADIILGGTVAPGGPFEQARQDNIKGGDHSVADVTARDTLPDYLRQDGMFVWVRSTTTMYQLVGGIANGNYITPVVTFGSGITLTSGSGAPVSTPSNGSLYARTDGTPTGADALYVRASGSWNGLLTAGITAGGDLTGTLPLPVVARINGATVPVAGALTTGNVLKVTGASALSYGAVDLAGGANHVTGLLPNGNQAAQTLTGGVTGNTGASVVEQLNGVGGVATVTCATVQGGTTDGWLSTRTVTTTTATTANQTLMTIAVDPDTVYDANIRVLARDTTASGGVRAHWVSDLFSRRTGTNSGNLERQGAAPTAGDVKGYGTHAAATVDVAISSNNILVRCTPGSANSTDWVVMADLVRNN